MVKMDNLKYLKEKKELFTKKINSEICDQGIRDIIDFYAKGVHTMNIGLMKMI